MHNEACIKQGSEKESLRQQLIEAKKQMEHYSGLIEFDATEQQALSAILHAADEQRMSPKAFIKAAQAAAELDAAKEAVLHCGYAVEEYNEREQAQNLFSCTSRYHTARAVVLGFEKSLTPSGWDILED